MAVETKQTEHTSVDGESTVIVNPAADFRISKGDRGFLLAESQVRGGSQQSVFDIFFRPHGLKAE